MQTRSLARVAVTALFLLSPLSATAELDKWDFSFWKARALDCGTAYQRYFTFDLQHLLGDLAEDMWRKAREEGADEEQIEVLRIRFDEGRAESKEDGFRRDNKLVIENFRTDRLVKGVDRELRYCLRENN